MVQFVSFCLPSRRIWLHKACWMRWGTVNNMAIEDGLFPLAYVTHTIVSTTVQIFMITHNTCRQLAKRCSWWGLEMANSLRKCWCRKFTCLFISVNISIRPAWLLCCMNGGSLLWHDGWRGPRETRTSQHFTPHNSAGCRHHLHHLHHHSISRQAYPTSLQNIHRAT